MTSNKVYLTITPDGRVEPGPDLSTDEATRAVVEQLGAAFSQRIADLEHEVESLRALVQKVAELERKGTWFDGDEYGGGGYADADVEPLIYEARALLSETS